jgi:peptidoglycan LD-endopeptidase CwlK
MSAGLIEIDYHLAKPTNNLALLAPRFRAAVKAAIAECEANQLPVRVYETYRSNELQAVYYTRGRTVKPPPTPVTNAKGNLYSWHGYGLAVDVIHREKLWGAGDDWFKQVADVFKKYECKWGGDWTSPDRPHLQWGPCKPSPSDRARQLMRSGGVYAVWEAVGALSP